jgi:hypothetical protein
MIKSDTLWSKFVYNRNEVECDLNSWKNHFEVVIIGAGMTGVSTAYWLKTSSFLGILGDIVALF